LAAHDAAILGEQGDDRENACVWAVVDAPGRFAVGRRTALLRNVTLTTDGRLRLGFQSVERRLYQLLSTSDLAGEWEPYPVHARGAAAVKYIIGDGTIVDLEAYADEARRFFRIVELGEPRIEPRASSR
jgi:hypothetical protein